MSGELSVLVFGILCVALLIALLSFGGKKKVASSSTTVAANGASATKPKNRAQRRKH
jgi:hypothetical protein